jgi:hypothetical protein
MEPYQYAVPGMRRNSKYGETTEGAGEGSAIPARSHIPARGWKKIVVCNDRPRVTTGEIFEMYHIYLWNFIISLD